MSSVLAAPTGTGAPLAPGSPRRRRLLVAALVLAVLAVLAASVLGGEGSVEEPLDPRNPRPEGAEALARVLEDQGVPVDVVRSQESLLGTDVDGATVVVTNPQDLGRGTADALLDHAAGAVALVAVGRGDVLADRLLGDDSPRLLATRSAGDRAADCDLPLVRDLSLALADGIDLDDPAGGTCFGRPGPLLETDELAPPSTWLLSAPEVLANGSVTEADDAALALRLLGQGERVVWYVADPADTAAEDGVRLTALLPPWLVPALALLAVATVAALLWRGRRLGPLVVEPLPVVVRAAESTHARGRIYHRSRDRAHAASVLREATRARLAHHLRLPADAPAAVVADAVSRRTSREAVAVLALLGPDHPPTRDTELADLGRHLSALEDEVHHA